MNSKVRWEDAAASFSVVGSFKVAAHNGPKPERCALAFWMMRPETSLGAGIAIWRPTGAAPVMQIDEAALDREVSQQFGNCIAERCKRRDRRHVRLAMAREVWCDHIGVTRQCGNQVAECARGAGKPVQEEQSGVGHVARCDIGEFGSIREAQSPSGSLITMCLHDWLPGFAVIMKPDILDYAVTMM
jgi:hypothetical protein